MKEVWVLGSEHSTAHKSISWFSSFPNFSNCDILIVNLQSLRPTRISPIRTKLYIEARRYIFDMLMTGEKQVFVIMSENQVLLDWLPFRPLVGKIKPLKLDEYPKDLIIEGYSKKIGECHYYIRGFDTSFIKALTDPTSNAAENYFFTSAARKDYDLETKVGFNLKNRAKQVIGGSFRFTISYGEAGIAGITREWEGSHVSGAITFLPPTTILSPEEAIDGLLNVLTGGEMTEPLPSWEQKIGFPGLDDLRTKIDEKEKRKETLVNEIEELASKIADVAKLRRLLWADGTPLENAVRDAFVILGFSEMRKIRAPNLEDWVMDFKYIDEFKHGVFEIKGAEKRTAMADLTQCNKWVEDYLLEKIKVKGIFVPNQHRRMDVRASTEKREHFEPNEIDYAQKREICILPTHEIFNTLTKKMNGNQEITRKSIEQKIASTNGLCKLT